MSGMLCALCGKEIINGDAFHDECRKIYMLRAEERDKRKTDLYWALRTRVLTNEELDEVRAHDYSLLVRQMQPFSRAEVQKEFNDALLNQFYMRLAAEKALAQ